MNLWPRKARRTDAYDRDVPGVLFVAAVFVVELGGVDEVQGVLEAAQPLPPSHVHGNVLNADEKAGEEQLRHDDRRQNCGVLLIAECKHRFCTGKH
eukprot:5990040-Prorocentrum_lima.AAC.1